MNLLKMKGIGFILYLLLQMTSAFNGLHLTRGTRSLTCNKAEVDSLVKGAQDTCSRISNVDTYIRSLDAKKPISVPSFDDRHGFRNLLNQYNSDLQTSKNNCQPWRNGNSVLSSIQAVVTASKEFEPKFKREFEQNQARVKHIKENHEDIAQVEAAIAALREEIKEAQAAIELAPTSSVKTHLGNVIRSKEEEVNDIIKNHEVLQAQRELGELIKFLEFVLKDTKEIKGKAESARTKIGSFRDNISTDSSAFKRDRNNAQEGLKRLNQEKQNNNQELANIRNRKDSLNKQIATERAQINTLNGQIADARKELQDIERTIAKSVTRTRRKKKIGLFFKFVGGWIIGSTLSRSARRDLDRLANQKRDLINNNNRRVQNINAQIAKSNKDIAHYQDMITSHESRARQLEQELGYFNNLNGNLQSVEKEVNSILPKIADAITGVSHMRDTFDKMRQHLEETIEKAKVSKTEAEVRNIKHFIYNDVDQLKCKWDKANEKIVPLAQCQ